MNRVKKYLIAILSVVFVSCVAAFFGGTNHTHSWIATEELDSDGNYVYVCSDCGETHTHTFSSAYTYDSVGHWYSSTCGHSEATRGYSEHIYEDGSDLCSVCGYDSSSAATYNIEFSYYRYDSDGDIETDENTGSYIEVGVTYTAVTSASDFTVNVEDGDTVQVGDIVSFTVKKSVYCEYIANSNDVIVEYPVVEINGEETITPDSDGVYTFTVDSDMATSDGDIIIWVSNVQTRSIAITGTGTASNPYTINTITDWLYFASYINNKDYYTSLDRNTAYWQLGCDLDFEGEEAYVIGNGYDSDYSVFMGNFNGNGKTMSNFVLTNEVSGSDGEYSSYLGLFGVCSAYSGVSAVIQNLTIKNFTIEGTAPASGACVTGAIVGYAVGFNLINCSAENGTVTVTGNSSYYSYAGGLVGILQSYVDEDYGYVYNTSMQYNTISDITVSGTGIIYGAGGLCAYAMPYAESAPIYILNNVATDITVTGGIFTGGIVGIMARYASVQNAYVTGVISASSTYTSGAGDYEDTVLDLRYAYGGGIVGYAGNDTYLGSSYFNGEVNASSSTTGDYAFSGSLYGGYSAAGYETYYSLALTLRNNLHDNASEENSATRSQLLAAGWNEEDWNLNGDYPVIISSTLSYTYTITVNVDGATYSQTDISTENTATSSLMYIPMSYRYLLGDSGATGGLNIYIRSGNKRTYGYYFDEGLTERIPAGYVITGDITIYAKYVDCSPILNKEYYVSGNGVTATITFEASGTYTYEQGAIYLTGTYEYDGQTITFKNGYFSRFAGPYYETSGTGSSATTTTVTITDNQASSYYDFFAYIGDDGNIYIYDCDEYYVDTYSDDYDYLARFFAKNNPLAAICEENVAFAGKYYDDSGNIYYFDIDSTGTYTSGTGGSIAYSFDDDGTLTVELVEAGREYTATIENNKIIYLTNTINGSVINLYAYDDFEGAWIQGGIVPVTYTFDGKGGWTYADGSSSDSGKYTIENDVLSFTLTDGTAVTVTINEDGTLSFKKTSGTQAVTYFAENSLAGVWYTYANAISRYTLTLGGINADGWGEAEFEGTTGFRYCVNEETKTSVELYMYYGDTLYGTLTYDLATGILTGVIDSTTYTFYMYDDFYGAWVGSSDDFALIVFNGFGMYDVAYAGTGTRAVNGSATITDVSKNSTKVTYTVDAATGVASFTYNNVVYTLVYDAFTGEIAVTGEDGSAIRLAAQDEFADVVFIVNGVYYTFDGRGYLGGGVVTITDGATPSTATYTVSDDGTIYITGGMTAAIQLTDSGYVMEIGDNSFDVIVENDFSGTYAVYGQYIQITIGATGFILENGVTIEGAYGDESVTFTYNDGILSFASGDVTYYITSAYNGLILSTTEDYTEDSANAYITEVGEIFGSWTNGTVTFTFDGTAGSDVVSYGSVKMTSGDTTVTGRYYVSDGVYTVLLSGGVTYTFTISDASSEGAYTNGTLYLVPVTAS
ncbi:MAG: hypothetical protein LUD27_05500 [Clostridia bacterium]|nr:hypothetical protein [Clostridia bacterium]